MMLRKVLFYIPLVVTLFTGPWWLFFALFICGFLFIEEPWYAGLCIGFIADVITSPSSIHFSFSFSVTALILFVFFVFFRSKVRIPVVL